MRRASFLFNIIAISTLVFPEYEVLCFGTHSVESAESNFDKHDASHLNKSQDFNFLDLAVHESNNIRTHILHEEACSDVIYFNSNILQNLEIRFSFETKLLTRVRLNRNLELFKIQEVAFAKNKSKTSDTYLLTFLNKSIRSVVLTV